MRCACRCDLHRIGWFHFSQTSNHLPRRESQSASAKNPASLQRPQASESRESHVAEPLQLSKVLPEAGPDKTEAWERPRVGQPAEVRSEEMNASKT